MEEKIDMVAQLLQEDVHRLSLIDAHKLRDYVECLSLFFTTSDSIIEEGSLKTMRLIINRKA